MSGDLKWYVAHTYSGYENTVAVSIERAVENRGMHDLIQEVNIPMETVTEITENGPKTVERKVFPGYVLVKMVMTDESWHLVRNIRGVTGFVGSANDAIPLTDEEIAALGVEKREIVVSYQVGDSVNSTYKVNVSISNCYVDSTVICGNSEAGGIVGKWDDGYNTAVSKSLTIDRCVFVGTVSCRSRAGGIIAYQTGSYPITITNCVSFGDIHHANSAEPIVVAEKNASGIFGGYNANAPTTVLGCYAKFAEHNQNYFVNIVTAADIATESFWSARVSLDLENIWQFVDGVLSLR